MKRDKRRESWGGTIRCHSHLALRFGLGQNCAWASPGGATRQQRWYTLLRGATLSRQSACRCARCQASSLACSYGSGERLGSPRCADQGGRRACSNLMRPPQPRPFARRAGCPRSRCGALGPCARRTGASTCWRRSSGASRRWVGPRPSGFPAPQGPPRRPGPPGGLISGLGGAQRGPGGWGLAPARHHACNT